MRTLRKYHTTAQALSDLAILESQGISHYLKGDTQGDTQQIVAGAVELQVTEDDFAAAHQLLTVADRERYEQNVPPEARKKTPARYLKLALATFIPTVGVLAWTGSDLTSTAGGLIIIVLAAAGVATLVGFSAAVLDL